MSAYLQCDRCGDDSDKYIKFILYDCSECGKKNLCESCIKWSNFNTKNKKPFCSECYDKKEVIFKIKPDIQNDIYQLYCLNEENNEIYYDTAFIPDFNTSVMMNKLFRKIKENARLDALEESDDEEEPVTAPLPMDIFFESMHDLNMDESTQIELFIVHALLSSTQGIVSVREIWEKTKPIDTTEQKEKRKILQ